MDFLKMMKQAKDMQSKMQGLQEEIAYVEAEGSAGGGMVHVLLSAQGELKKIKIDPSLLKSEEAGILEDLIMLAHQQANEKAKAEVAARTKAAMGGIDLPAGLKLPV